MKGRRKGRGSSCSIWFVSCCYSQRRRKGGEEKEEGKGEEKKKKEKGEEKVHIFLRLINLETARTVNLFF